MWTAADARIQQTILLLTKFLGRWTLIAPVVSWLKNAIAGSTFEERP